MAVVFLGEECLLLVVLFEPLPLSFLAMPGLPCFLCVTHKSTMAYHHVARAPLTLLTCIHSLPTSMQ